MVTLVFAAGWLGVAPVRAAVERATIASGRSAVLVDKRDLFLEVAPEAGDGWHAFARRWTGSAADSVAISKANRNARRPLAGVRYRVPYELLQEDVKLAVIRSLFPKDQSDAQGWTHFTRGEAVDEVAIWFTGGRAAAVSLRKTQGLGTGRLRAGTRILVPNELLDGIFRYVVPARPAAAIAASRADPPPAAALRGGPGSPSPVGASPLDNVAASSLLTYGADNEGPYAVYRLRPGEALYSSVVVRFTGRLEAEDVNALAMEIAKRSGITDVTDIPIGFPVHVALDLLLPEFLPEGDPRRLEYEVEQKVASQYKNVVEARGLEGVTVVLDAGHGGVDVGATMSGIWESLYVYDIMLRVKRRLELDSRARVHVTTRDGAEWKIPERDVLPFSRGHAVLTTPPYPILDSIVGVNLRWYLANSLLRQATAKGGSPDRVIFISIHADSLHPGIRGATIYVPDSAGSSEPFRRSGAVFAARKEVREQPSVSFPSRERQRSEGLSRDLAENLIAEFRRRDFAVHPFNPVRDKIYRGKRAWVPAVLRYNAIPAKLLLEVCNLANTEDRKLLTSVSFREDVARTIVEGIRRYFKESG